MIKYIQLLIMGFTYNHKKEMEKLSIIHKVKWDEFRARLFYYLSVHKVKCCDLYKYEQWIMDSKVKCCEDLYNHFKRK